jgi:Domain of unknown function (DUF4202)
MLEELAVLTPNALRPPLPQSLFTDFPSIFVRPVTDGRPHLLASQWEAAAFDTWTFDRALDELAREPFSLVIADDNGGRPEFALEVLNRCQRLIDRRNRHSQGQLFDRVLKHHRALYDVSKPMVRADYNHALDVWQWMLRLDPNASLAAQLAALFHEVERSASRDALGEAGVGEGVRDRVAAFVADHERQSDDPEVALLNDADALSFFSLDSNRFAAHCGPEQTRKKVASMLARMRDSARAKLAHVRVRPEIRAWM